MKSKAKTIDLLNAFCKSHRNANDNELLEAYGWLARGTDMLEAKFKTGDHVTHDAAHDGSFPKSTGFVTEVTPWNTGDGHSYKVKCDKTGNVLPVLFKESELSAV